jgi:DNA-binding NarL/FixJ family response regulator
MPVGNRTRYTAIIADDHEIVRAGLAAALRKPGLIEADGLEVVAEAGHGLETIELVKRHRPDLLILDVSMPFASGAEIVADIRRWSRETRIVMFTAVTSPGLLRGLVEAGVDGLFAKAGDNAELFSRLPLILRGGRHISDVLVTIIRSAAEPAPLTRRERQTLNMIISGKTNAEIARLMGISPRTVEKHRASLMMKLDVRTTVELMARALKEGLIEEQRLP